MERSIRPLLKCTPLFVEFPCNCLQDEIFEDMQVELEMIFCRG